MPHMFFSDDNIKKLERGCVKSHVKYIDILLLIGPLHARLTNEQAREFILHGAGRRLRILDRCLQKIFFIYPPARMEGLSDDELIEICIHLHAFFVNLFGLFDNLAWVIVHEKAVSLRRSAVGLYQERTQAILTDRFREYLNTEKISSWHNDHLKEFRDELAHRIPLYVPPFAVTQDGQVMNPFPCFSGSVFDGRDMIMHGQLLADFETVSEVVSKFVEFEFPPIVSLVS